MLRTNVFLISFESRVGLHGYANVSMELRRLPAARSPLTHEKFLKMEEGRELDDLTGSYGVKGQRKNKGGAVVSLSDIAAI